MPRPAKRPGRRRTPRDRLARDIGRALSRSTNLDDAAAAVLAAVGTSFDAIFTALWLVDERAALLRCRHTWRAAPTAAREFDVITRRIAFGRGVGGPGRAWETGAAVWLSDIQADPNFPRSHAAAAERLRTAVESPIASGSQVVGVLEVVNRPRRARHEPTIKTLAAVAARLAPFVEREQADETVRSAEARTAAIVDTALDAVILMDADGVITEFNPAAERIFGWSRADAVGRPLAEVVVPPALRDAHRRGLARYLATGESTILGKRLELMARHRDGTDFPVELSVTRVASPGRPMFAGYLRDISARVAGERRAAFVAKAAAVLSTSLDYPETLRQLATLAVPEVANACAIDVLAPDGTLERVALVHEIPDVERSAWDIWRRYPPKADGPVGRALAEGRPVLYADVTDELLSAAAYDADHLALLRRIDMRSIMVAPLTARDRTLGVVIFASTHRGRRYTEDDLAFAQDLAGRAAIAIDNARLYQESERRRVVAETLARAARSFAEDLDVATVAARVVELVLPLFDVASAVLRLLEPDGTLVAAGLAGLARERFPIGHRLPAGIGMVGRAVTEQRAVSTNDVLREANVRMTDDFRDRLATAGEWAVASAPLIVHGKTIGALSLGHPEARRFSADEIALLQTFADQAAIALENASLYRAAQEASRLKDEFLATVSHELRTPLTAILGWARMLQQGHLDADGRARAVEILNRNARLQNQLVADLLDVSRAITGKLQLEPVAVDIEEIVRTSLATARASAEAKGLTLTVTAARPAQPVLGDPERLQQVIWNLLSNAVKFTPPGGRVDVEITYVARAARVVVRDTGIGIAPAFLPHIFERFRQADAGPTRRHGGLGLGLAIVRHLVELHGGTVAVESAGEGHGAAFTVTLPVGRSQAPEIAIPQIGRGKHLAGVSVLVVEDDADTAALWAATLRTAGADVETTHSVPDAMASLIRRRVDLLMADIGLPGTDGLELIRRVRAGETGDPRIPAVAVTAYARPDDRERILAAGYDGFLPKPVEPDDLVAIVVATLATRRD